MSSTKKIYLASKSPRRKELLQLMGLSYEILLKEVDESFPSDLDTKEVAAYIAQKKADAFELKEDGIIITADTVVIIENEILGKPNDKADALNMLSKLNGKKHLVVTGVSIKTTQEIISFSDITEVYFKTLSQADLEFYIDNYQPYDKAGAYGIQEWIGLVAIEKIVGSYTNVMGLPTEKLFEHLRPYLS
ncbi:Maf family protein [Pelobium sp.]|nr:Maf family protein [Pelobium sp.]MDA9554738.1 Maf family protein [Pelobium sp.]